jgi:hypothetical protein
MKVIRYTDYTTSGEWAMQNKRTVDIAEADLRKWTDALRRCRTDVNMMRHIASMNLEFDWSDDHEIDVTEIRWDGRWGAPPTDPNARCFAPIGRYRALTNPRHYWKPKDQWWQPPTPR